MQLICRFASRPYYFPPDRKFLMQITQPKILMQIWLGTVGEIWVWCRILAVALFEKGFVLVNSKHDDYDSQKEFFERFYVQQSLTCDSHIEKIYYSERLKKIATPICRVCGSEIIEGDTLEEITNQKQSYMIVLPTCSRDCGRFKLERKRPVKRPVPVKAAMPGKKAKRGGGRRWGSLLELS